MNEKTTYVKMCKKFTQVSHHIIQNENLSLTEIGMMSKFLSYMDSYVIHKETERKKSGLGKVAFNNAWSILENEKYIKSEQVRSEGHIKYKYTISNMPLNDIITECDHVQHNHQQETDGGELIAESNSQYQADTNQVVENGRLNTDDSNELSNIYISNEEIINIEYRNKELNNTELSNQNTINIELTNVDYTNKNITNIEVDDNVINNSPLVDVIKNIDIGKDVTVQEEVLNIIRKYIIDNNVLPFCVELQINEMKQLEEFVSNKDILNAHEWVKIILDSIEIQKYHNTNSSNSLYLKLKRKLDNYILFNDLNKPEVYTRVQQFLDTHKFKDDQVTVSDITFNQIVNKLKLYQCKSGNSKSKIEKVYTYDQPLVETNERTNTIEGGLSYLMIDDVLNDKPILNHNYDEPIRFL